MQYKNATKIIIDKRKLDILLRLGCPDKQILELIKTGEFTKTGDSLVDETLECLLDVKCFRNWGGSRENSGRKSNNSNKLNQVDFQDEKQDEKQDENHLVNQDIFQVVDIDKDIYNINNNKIFKKPTLEEVKAYCLERKNNVDAERWLNYYTSNGWKVGKNPMKDWKAAVRTWESKEKPKKTQETVFIDENMRIDEDMSEFKDMTFDACCKASEWLLQNMYCQTLAKDKFVEIVRKFK